MISWLNAFWFWYGDMIENDSDFTQQLIEDAIRDITVI